MFTLRHLIDSFTTHVGLLVRAGETAPATLQWYKDFLKKLNPFGDYPADTLRLHHIGTIKLSNAFVRVVKRLYSWAVEQDLVPKDPFAKLTIPPCGKRERVLSRAELRRLYRASPSAFRRLLFAQIHTLARPGEIRQLVWGQIDWANRVILLAKFKAQKLRGDKLKVRAIPLDKKVLRLLRNLYRKSADKSDKGRVFIGTRGKPWTAFAEQQAMRRARTVADLGDGEERIVLYHLRHTSATNAIRKDLNLKLVAEIMGHARTTTTERYLHLDHADLVAAIDKLGMRHAPRQAG